MNEVTDLYILNGFCCYRHTYIDLFIYFSQVLLSVTKKDTEEKQDKACVKLRHMKDQQNRRHCQCLLRFPTQRSAIFTICVLPQSETEYKKISEIGTLFLHFIEKRNLISFWLAAVGSSKLRPSNLLKYWMIGLASHHRRGSELGQESFLQSQRFVCLTWYFKMFF